jgi:ribA/ribD-fused uncharacterized protein
MRITDKYVFFYKDWLSNYQKTNFYYPNINNPIFNFTSTEQAFMYFKAIYFKDYDIASKIYETRDNPDVCRKLGRLVKNYDDINWDKIRYELFYDLNYQKYLQDSELAKKLMDPKFDNRIFVEASPIDKIWGVGLDENNDLILDSSNWKGLNYLGEILTDIRKQIIEYWNTINS